MMPFAMGWTKVYPAGTDYTNYCKTQCIYEFREIAILTDKHGNVGGSLTNFQIVQNSARRCIDATETQGKGEIQESYFGEYKDRNATR